MNFKITLPFFAVLFFLTGFHFEAEAQDPRFAQFYAAPLHLNPAMTGVFEGRFRVNANYREQYNSILGNDPFRTVGAAFDMRYKIVGDDYMGIGVNAIHDEAGIGAFTQDRAYLNLSYMKQLSGGRYSPNDQYLIFGGQLGAGQNSVNWNQFWYSAQFDDNNLAPNTNLDNGEPGISGDNSTTNVFLDFNAGLMWYAIFGENTSIWAGAAMNHLNSPDISFLGERETLYTRWVGHFGGEFSLNPSLSLLPAIAVMGQGPSLSTTAGANFRYTSHDWNEVAIRTGAWAHVVSRVDGEGNLETSGSKLSMDAVTVAMILEINSWNVGVSYDVTTSNLKTANNSRGAFELSLIYVHPARDRIKVNCPKF